MAVNRWKTNFSVSKVFKRFWYRSFAEFLNEKTLIESLLLVNYKREPNSDQQAAHHRLSLDYHPTMTRLSNPIFTREKNRLAHLAVRLAMLLLTAKDRNHIFASHTMEIVHPKLYEAHRWYTQCALHTLSACTGTSSTTGAVMFVMLSCIRCTLVVCRIWSKWIQINLIGWRSS